MSTKFKKDREVDFAYFAMPLYYTGIRHPNNSNKELVLIDDYGSHYVAAYRNNNLCKVGIHFTLKKEIKNKKNGFILKGKFFQLNKRYGRVF